MPRWFYFISLPVVLTLHSTGIKAQTDKKQLVYPTHFTGMFSDCKNCHFQRGKILLPGVHQAFFCRVENKIEKNSNVGFRFRLGSLDYVNMLENKK